MHPETRDEIDRFSTQDGALISTGKGAFLLQLR
jgi:hypothetical protein